MKRINQRERGGRERERQTGIETETEKERWDGLKKWGVGVGNANTYHLTKKQHTHTKLVHAFTYTDTKKTPRATHYVKKTPVTEMQNASKHTHKCTI